MEHANERRKVVIRNERGESLEVELTPERGRVFGYLWIANVMFRVRAVSLSELERRFLISDGSRENLNEDSRYLVIEPLSEQERGQVQPRSEQNRTTLILDNYGGYLTVYSKFEVLSCLGNWLHNDSAQK